MRRIVKRTAHTTSKLTALQPVASEELTSKPTGPVCSDDASTETAYLTITAAGWQHEPGTTKRHEAANDKSYPQQQCAQ